MAQQSSEPRRWTISHDHSAEDDRPQAFRVTGPEIAFGSVEVMRVSEHEAALKVTDEMVERGASALALAHDYNPNLLPHKLWAAAAERYRRDARVVLEAALSPTTKEKM